MNDGTENTGLSYDDLYLNRLTVGLSTEKRRELVRWYAQENETMKVEVARRQMVIAKDMKRERDENKLGEFYFACLVRAVDQIRRRLDSKYSQELDPGQMRELDRLCIARIRRPRKKKASKIKILIEKNYFYVIRKLRDKEKLPWRDVAKYLEKTYRVKISFDRLRKVFNEVLAERKQRQAQTADVAPGSTLL